MCIKGIKNLWAAAQPENNATGPGKMEEEIWEAHRSLQLAYEHFEQAQGEDIIDATIYEIKAAESRFNRLLAEAKAKTGYSHGREEVAQEWRP